jgi:hypothetical protein
VRSFERDRTFFDPWHYVTALEKKPGALRNGTPFKDWALPPALQEMRDRMRSTGSSRSRRRKSSRRHRDCNSRRNPRPP